MKGSFLSPARLIVQSCWKLREFRGTRSIVSDGPFNSAAAFSQDGQYIVVAQTGTHRLTCFRTDTREAITQAETITDIGSLCTLPTAKSSSARPMACLYGRQAYPLSFGRFGFQAAIARPLPWPFPQMGRSSLLIKVPAALSFYDVTSQRQLATLATG